MSWFWIIVLIIIIVIIILVLNYIFGSKQLAKFKGLKFQEIIDVKKIPEPESENSTSLKSDQVSDFSENGLEEFYKCQKPFIGRGSKGEKICREFLQNYFKLPFQSCRPHFLINPETDKALELDCYEGSLRLAVEYQGQAHYEHVQFFHKNYDDFIEQRRRDEFKASLCSRLGIYLIRVPYTINLKDIPNFILSRLPSNLLKY